MAERRNFTKCSPRQRTYFARQAHGGRPEAGGAHGRQTDIRKKSRTDCTQVAELADLACNRDSQEYVGSFVMLMGVANKK